MIEMKNLCVILLILCFSLGGTNCKKSQEEQTPTVEKRVEKKTGEVVKKKSKRIKAVKSGEATIKIVDGTGNVFGIELTNKVPVRGVQFTVEGVQMNEVRTTSRTTGFLSDFNKESGKVVMLSTSEDKISSGTGLIAEVVCDKKGKASLSGIKIVK
jgi:hypothetical protein